MALSISKIQLDEEYVYIPESERGEIKPFSVSFKRIPLVKLAELQDESIGIRQSGTYTININSQHYSALKLSLVGWENIMDGKKPLKFRLEHGKASTESLEIIPAELRTEIASVILEVSKDPANAEVYLNGVEDNIEEEDGTDK